MRTGLGRILCWILGGSCGTRRHSLLGRIRLRLLGWRRTRTSRLRRSRRSRNTAQGGCRPRR